MDALVLFGLIISCRTDPRSYKRIRTRQLKRIILSQNFLIRLASSRSSSYPNIVTSLHITSTSNFSQNHFQGVSRILLRNSFFSINQLILIFHEHHVDGIDIRNNTYNDKLVILGIGRVDDFLCPANFATITFPVRGWCNCNAVVKLLWQKASNRIVQYKRISFYH